MALNIGTGISIGGGINIGSSGGVGPSGNNGVIGFSEMTAGGSQSQWLEDPTATVTSNGFVLNAVSGGAPNMFNGVAIYYLTTDNLTFFSTYGTGNKTATWAAGSSYTTMTVNLTTNQSGSPELVFFMNDVVAFPATFVFPVTFS